MNEIRTLMNNSLLMFFNKMAKGLTSLFSSFILARYLGERGFGNYSFVLTIMYFFVLIDDSWINPIAMRELIRSPVEIRPKILGNILILKFIFALISDVAILNYVFFKNFPPEVRLLIYCILVLLPLMSLISSYVIVFYVYSKITQYLIVGLLDNILFIFFLIGAIILRCPTLYFFVIMILSNVFILPLVIHLSNKNIILDIRMRFIICKSILKTSAPLLLTAIFVAIYHRINQIMLFEICGASFLGIYIAAFKVTEAFNIIPLSIRDIILSSLSKFFYHSKESFRALYKLIFKYLAIIIVPIAVIITIFSEEIINFLYGAAFVKASSALSILIWSEIFIYLGILNRQILISSDNQIKDPIFTGIAAITNITLNVILIPKFNFVGAAISFLISSAMGSIMGYFISSTRDYSRSMFKALLKPFISVAVILLFINFLKPTKIIIFICFPFIYALILYLLKGIDASDLELVRVFSSPFLKKVK